MLCGGMCFAIYRLRLDENVELSCSLLASSHFLPPLVPEMAMAVILHPTLSDHAVRQHQWLDNSDKRSFYMDAITELYTELCKKPKMVTVKKTSGFLALSAAVVSLGESLQAMCEAMSISARKDLVKGSPDRKVGDTDASEASDTCVMTRDTSSSLVSSTHFFGSGATFSADNIRVDASVLVNPLALLDALPLPVPEVAMPLILHPTLSGQAMTRNSWLDSSVKRAYFMRIIGKMYTEYIETPELIVVKTSGASHEGDATPTENAKEEEAGTTEVPKSKKKRTRRRVRNPNRNKFAQQKHANYTTYYGNAAPNHYYGSNYAYDNRQHYYNQAQQGYGSSEQYYNTHSIGSYAGQPPCNYYQAGYPPSSNPPATNVAYGYNAGTNNSHCTQYGHNNPSSYGSAPNYYYANHYDYPQHYPADGNTNHQWNGANPSWAPTNNYGYHWPTSYQAASPAYLESSVNNGFSGEDCGFHPEVCLPESNDSEENEMSLVLKESDLNEVVDPQEQPKPIDDALENQDNADNLSVFNDALSAYESTGEDSVLLNSVETATSQDMSEPAGVIEISESSSGSLNVEAEVKDSAIGTPKTDGSRSNEAIDIATVFTSDESSCNSSNDELEINDTGAGIPDIDSAKSNEAIDIATVFKTDEVASDVSTQSVKKVTDDIKDCEESESGSPKRHRFPVTNIKVSQPLYAVPKYTATTDQDTRRRQTYRQYDKTKKESNHRGKSQPQSQGGGRYNARKKNGDSFSRSTYQKPNRSNGEEIQQWLNGDDYGNGYGNNSTRRQLKGGSKRRY
ncbi:hypothetical protein BKA69DRAFT_923670 [Paraphysoderma sedebokerense]|nr:hypothetical protein BKA69DRAFT_923670 [Paraphysoderma sedebokerense]